MTWLLPASWQRIYLAVLIVATTAVVPFPTPRSHIEAPLVPQRATVVGYDRAEFGPGWGRANGGCTTREAVLADAYGQECAVTWMAWDTAEIADPYTGQPMAPADVEIDHILPVSAAWDLGAHTWAPHERAAFYNDQRNLIAVSSKANQAKGDKLPSEWMPTDRRAGCAYGRRLVNVAKQYALPLPEADLKAVRRACSGIAGLAARREL
ncbi:DUF1524 domain-containing protein [Corynebacterium sp. Marseille-P4321]|uniref:GmrSD restriction endonuclease domain-containing protein n=1 Tax=Corynebacterium sp. Marseille-P4321 TaxID=2736603 RepID=UPI000893E628|nr:DUF1524 domain-containing protein [Corynebacterium sp. Marseille-P4321]OEY23326.1 hypothetical protein A0K93_03810 [Corynebacterium sp. BCW_4722]